MSLTKAFINILETPCSCFHGIWCWFGKNRTQVLNSSTLLKTIYHLIPLYWSFACRVTPSIETARERTRGILNYRFDLQSSCLLAPIPQNSHLTLSTCVVPLMLSTSLNEFLEWGHSPEHLAELILCLLLLTYSSITTPRVFFRN